MAFGIFGAARAVYPVRRQPIEPSTRGAQLLPGGEAKTGKLNADPMFVIAHALGSEIARHLGNQLIVAVMAQLPLDEVGTIGLGGCPSRPKSPAAQRPKSLLRLTFALKAIS